MLRPPASGVDDSMLLNAGERYDIILSWREVNSAFYLSRGGSEAGRAILLGNGRNVRRIWYVFYNMPAPKWVVVNNIFNIIRK